MKSGTKYVGIDTHTASCRFYVRNDGGKREFECTVPTTDTAILDLIHSLKGRVVVAFEEGNLSEWLYELLVPHVADVIVCNPRENHSGRGKSKTDEIDAEQLSLWLYKGVLKPVYHKDHGTARLRNLVHIYEQLVADRSRSKNRLKAIYRSRAISTRGQGVYGAARREEWISRLPDDGTQTRARLLIEQIGQLTVLVEAAKRGMVAELRKHPGRPMLMSIPGIGDVRASQLIATIRTPLRFRRNRQLWAYGGLAVVMHGSGETEYVDGTARRRKHATTTRGLNRNCNRRVKAALKGAAMSASATGELKPFYDRLLARDLAPELARVTLARKIATLVLVLWKKGERFDVTKLENKTV
jgi:transposase